MTRGRSALIPRLLRIDAEDDARVVAALIGFRGEPSFRGWAAVLDSMRPDQTSASAVRLVHGERGTAVLGVLPALRDFGYASGSAIEGWASALLSPPPPVTWRGTTFDWS